MLKATEILKRLGILQQRQNLNSRSRFRLLSAVVAVGGGLK